MKIFLRNEHPIKLDAAALTWFNNLKNQYLALPPEQTSKTDVQRKISAAIDELLLNSSDTLTSQNLFDLEDWVLALLTGQALASRLKSLRDDYQEVFGKEAWDKIQPTLLTQIEPGKEEENRAEARRLQEELHWQASIRPWASRMRQWMMISVLLVLVAAMLILWLAVWWCGKELALIIIAIGIAGGTVGTIQRIQSANLASSRALMLARYSWLKLGVIISPVLGGVFALVLTLMLMSKTLTPGLVIPDMSLEYATNSIYSEFAATNKDSAARPAHIPIASKEDPGERDQSGMSEAGGNHPTQYNFFSLPVSFAAGKDLALLLLLAFAAGFSERLVPDMLTKLAEPPKP